MDIKYFICKLDHDSGITYLKTSGSTKKSVVEILMEHEGCPKSAVKVKEVDFTMFSFPAGILWKLNDKPFVLKMVNRKAVKVIEYLGQSAKIKYVKTGKECTVSRTMIREYIPKTKS
jgi:hypothetical protein